MHNTLSIELLAARKVAGLTQGDLAHLLDTQQSRISAYETGKTLPSQEHLLKLALIYGRAFERFHEEQLSHAQTRLLRNLDTLPHDVRITADTFNRLTTIERLRDRLLAEADEYDIAA